MLTAEYVTEKEKVLSSIKTGIDGTIIAMENADAAERAQMAQAVKVLCEAYNIIEKGVKADVYKSVLVRRACDAGR